jgi:hypothetical protein
MKRISLIAVALGLLVRQSSAQEDLPAPPKPPKSKAVAPEAEGEKTAPEKEAQAKPSPDAVPSAEAKGELRHRLLDGQLPRSGRLRINVPFFRMDLRLGAGRPEHRGVPYREPTPADERPIAEREAVPAPGVEEIPAPGKSDDESWRYRWHKGADGIGRWWYWLPSERWVYWENGRWHEFAPEGRARSLVEIDLRGNR